MLRLENKSESLSPTGVCITYKVDNLTISNINFKYPKADCVKDYDTPEMKR